MNAAHDIRAYEPEPYSGHAKPPETVTADNDAADTVAKSFQRIAAWLPLFKSEFSPVEILLGGLRILLPVSEGALSPRQTLSLERAKELVADGREGAASVHVDRLERSAWPRGIDPHYIWPALRDFVVVAPSKRRKAEFDRACDLNKALAPAPVPQSVLDKLAQARKAEATAEILRASNPKKNQRAIKDHLDNAKRLKLQARALQGAAADEHWSHRADQEIVALASARGEVVEKTKAGHTRIMTRAGIQHAYEAGYLQPEDGKRLSSANLYETAKRYRDAYEIIAGRTTPNGSDASGGMKGPQVRIAEAGEALRTMRTGLDRLEVSVLDRVCGEEIRARETATILALGFDKVRKALVSGLTTATTNIRAARAVKDTDERMTRDRLQAAHVEIQAAERMAS